MPKNYLGASCAEADRYPHKFHVTVNLADFIKKYESLKTGEHLEDVEVRVGARIYTKVCHDLADLALYGGLMDLLSDPPETTFCSMTFELKERECKLCVSLSMLLVADRFMNSMSI